MMTISIIVPIFNQQNFLNKSIPCLLNQTYHDIEIILVNDGSTDLSDEIIKKYAQNDNRIIMVEKNNGGLIDATVAGIRRASGEYLCFLDPDDFIRKDYILNFVNLFNETPGLDFYSTGFYYDNNGQHSPYKLKENKIYNADNIKILRGNFLFDGINTVSNNIFISRWNKMYKTRTIKKFIDEFSNQNKVSLGEDTIFNFLMLNNCNSGLSSSLINGYYYNIGNQKSMMNSDGLNSYINKANYSFETFKKLLTFYGLDDVQAYVLYYDLISALIKRTQTDIDLTTNLYSMLKNDKVFIKSTRILISSNIGIKKKIKLRIFLFAKNYKDFFNIYSNIKRALLNYKKFKDENVNFFINIKKLGIHKALKRKTFLRQRTLAFEELSNNIQILDARISLIIDDYLSYKKNYHQTIEKNIFIFWWDGFESAPEIVKCCLESVKRCYKGYNIILITKTNYLDYTNINRSILEAFNAGDISVQTFSDILRFNLLYNNGGIWTDATIYFRSKLNLIENLQEKSFESLCFNTSNDFLTYKGQHCSWSGYLIASRKHGEFVGMMNYIFEQYFLKYHTYSIYFFIDAAFMICKLHKVDDNVLSKVQTSDESMFDLCKVLRFDYYENEFNDNTLIPQKLSWFADTSRSSDNFTNYDYMLSLMNK